MRNSKQWDMLKSEFTFPFELHDYQLQGVEEISKSPCTLLKYKVGLGKTVTSTAAALLSSLNEGVEQIIVLCPPILIDQWAEWLESIPEIPAVDVFRGTPKVRNGMHIENASIVIMSYNIFRGKDYRRIQQMLLDTKTCIIADELSLKSLRSSTYKKLKQVVYRKLRVLEDDVPHHKLVALNATPISSPEHVFNWAQIMTPGAYRNKKDFERLHVLSVDNWGKPLTWKNEDIMQRKMGRFSVDTDKTVKVPELTPVETSYALSKKHKNLYDEVKNGLIAELPPDKIELALNSMFSTLQRLVILPREFGLDIESPVLEYVDSVLSQIPPEDGVLIYTRHVMVSKVLAEHIPDCVAIYGGGSQTARDEGISQLKSGEKKILVGNLDSLGVGLNAQYLNHVIFVELPFRADKETQAIGRVHRQGQQKTCTVHYPIAKGTVQRQIYSRLLRNGEDIEKVMRSKEDVEQFLN